MDITSQDERIPNIQWMQKTEALNEKQNSGIIGSQLVHIRAEVSENRGR
ncbi:hypothetical protein Mpsy_2907 [Methanolobus psychrophilus R15]|nr:hypothetical protein Mpsy_2907 [Methanolobus psychrophilus R15]